MKVTFSDLQDVAQESVGLTDATTLTKLKRDINIGATKLLSMFHREYNRKSKTTNLVADQQFYQMPEDADKIKELIVTSGGITIPMQLVSDEASWQRINMTTLTGNPTHFFVRGNDEFGLFPIPSASVTNGIKIVYGPQHIEMTEDDYTTGTLTVTNGSQTITGSGTTFTAKMVGQWLQVTDGTDGRWYRVSAYSSATSITIENYYQGASGSSKAYRIGQVVDLPEFCAEAPADYATFRHYKRRGDRERADDFKGLFKEALQQAKSEYGITTDQAVIYTESHYPVYSPFRGDALPGEIT